jgi:hypothetical protein
VNEAIVLLLLLWAVLLLPGALRSRKSSPHTTVGGFERAMDVLRAKPGHGRELMVPRDAGRIVTRNSARQAVESGAPTEDPVVARRRSWFLRLLAGTGVTLLLAIGLGGWLWLPFVSLALLTGGYTALLRHLKLQRDQARRVVRDLEIRRVEDAPPADAEVPPTTPERATVDAGNLALQSVRLRRWDG